ncbi:RNA-dependent RNA polymerase 1, partial [Araneus ventricosus]
PYDGFFKLLNKSVSSSVE